MNDESLISGWWVFAGVLLLIAGVLNIIWGIAAIGDSKFFTENATYILSGLQHLGMDRSDHRRARARRRLLAVLRRRIRALVRHLHRLAQRDRGAAVDLGLPLLVAGVFALAIIVIYKLAEGPDVTTTGAPRSGV